MFDLEKAIRDWRGALERAARLDSDSLDELESHLRDDVDARRRQGVAAELAFKAAVKSLGSVRDLRKEFRRGESIASAIRSLSKLCLCVVAVMALRIACRAELTLPWRAAAIFNAIALLAPILGHNLIVRSIPVIGGKTLRNWLGLMFGIVAMAAGIAFMNVLLPNLILTEEEIGVVVLWTLTLMTFLGSAGALLEEAYNVREEENAHVQS